MSRGRRASREASKLWALLVRWAHEELGRDVEAMAQAEALLPVWEGVPFRLLEPIVAWAAQQRLPAMYPMRDFVEGWGGCPTSE